MQLTLEIQNPNDLQLLLQYIRLLPSAKILAEPKKVAEPTQPEEDLGPKFGFAKGFFTYVAPDFDETPPGFEEYMPQTNP